MLGQKSTVFNNAPPSDFCFMETREFRNHLPNNTWNLLFSPRLGVVWDPDGKGTADNSFFRCSAAGYVRVVLSGTTNNECALWNGNRHSGSSGVGLRTHIRLGVAGGSPFPAAYSISKNIAFPSLMAYMSILPLNTKPTYMTQWNFSYQRQLDRQTGWLRRHIWGIRRRIFGRVRRSMRRFTSPAHPPRPIRIRAGHCTFRIPLQVLITEHYAI